MTFFINRARHRYINIQLNLTCNAVGIAVRLVTGAKFV